MKKIFALVTIATLLHVNSFAQTKQKSIKELFQVMQQDSLMEKMMNGMVPAMLTNMKNMIKQSEPVLKSNATAEEKSKYEVDTKKRDEKLAKLDGVMITSMESAKKMLRSLMDNDMVAIYDKHFTQSEIKDFIAFYKSPSGAKMLKVMPEIQKDMMEILMKKYIPEMQKDIINKTKEIFEEKTK